MKSEKMTAMQALNVVFNVGEDETREDIAELRALGFDVLPVAPRVEILRRAMDGCVRCQCPQHGEALRWLEAVALTVSQ